MNRLEALRALGLDEDATDEDIKTAYRETAQILHPDRFATNKKLQDRATEQFKNLQEAYDFLTSSKGRRKAGGSSASARSARAPYDDVDARLAGIAAARRGFGELDMDLSSSIDLEAARLAAETAGLHPRK